MPVLLASAKKVVAHHASDKQEYRDGQDHYEQKLGKPKPRWILFFLISLVAIRCHALFSRRAKCLTLDRGLYDPPIARQRQTLRGMVYLVQTSGAFEAARGQRSVSIPKGRFLPGSSFLLNCVQARFARGEDGIQEAQSESSVGFRMCSSLLGNLRFQLGTTGKALGLFQRFWQFSLDQAHGKTVGRGEFRSYRRRGGESGSTPSHLGIVAIRCLCLFAAG